MEDEAANEEEAIVKSKATDLLAQSLNALLTKWEIGPGF